MSDCPIDLAKWLTEFDHFDAEYNDDPYPILSELRGESPLLWSEKYGGFWVTLRHEDMKRVCHDPATFSSRKVNIPDQWDFAMPPIKVDPPEHTRFRSMLQRAFSVTEVRRWEAATWEIANSLIDDFTGLEINASAEYARYIPMAITCRLLGIKDPDRDLFADWMHQVVDGGFDPESALTALSDMTAYLTQIIAEHRLEPRDDLTSLLIDAEIDGNRFSEPELVGAAWLLFVAGIDTTWGAIGCSIVHLANFPDDRRRLIEALDDPDSETWDRAIEEFLRVYSPATMAREVTRDVELAGRQLHTGDMVLLPFPAANRDPEAFDRPDEFLLNRERNNHAAFGMGIHRCLGLHFAKMEMKVALQAFLRRIPEFQIEEGATITYGGGQVRRPGAIPLILSRPPSTEWAQPKHASGSTK
jgi:hypothetical protein